MTHQTFYHLKCPDPLPVQEVVFSHVLMMDACRAGTPAGRFDGSWILAQSTDVTDIATSCAPPPGT
eukprot:7920308-Pyramimonas_sp.AAC.1